MVRRLADTLSSRLKDPQAFGMSSCFICYLLCSFVEE